MPELQAADRRWALLKIERLRMTDYAALFEAGGVSTELAVVLATFGAWKTARHAARA